MPGSVPQYDTSFIIVANAQKEKRFNKIAIISRDAANLLCVRQGEDPTQGAGNQGKNGL
jgi:hypothetical protein